MGESPRTQTISRSTRTKRIACGYSGDANWDALSAEIVIAANSSQEYWIDVRVNGVLLHAQIDTGMTQPTCEVGLGLGPEEFDRLAQDLQPLGTVEQDVGEPMPVKIPLLKGSVSIEGLDNSKIQTGIASLNDNLLGVCFFHHLSDCELVWNLPARTMTLRRIT